MTLPLPRITSIRDFYAFEQHVKTCANIAGLGLIPQWYEVRCSIFECRRGSSATSIPSGSQGIARWIMNWNCVRNP